MSALPASQGVTDEQKLIIPTNAYDLKTIYLAVEQQIQSDLFKAGRVEFAVLEKRHDASSELPIMTERVAVGVKSNVLSTEGRDDAFYQGCSSMVAMLDRAPPTMTEVYGIATDCQFWRFMKLDRETKRIVCSKGVTLLVLSENPKELDAKSVIIFAYLFEVFGIPVEIDMEAAIERVANWENKSNLNKCQQLLGTFLTVCNLNTFRGMFKSSFL